MTAVTLPKHALALLLAVFCCAAVAADKPAAEKPAAEKPKDVFHHLKFRDLGPAIAGGRVTAVVGIAGNPRVYYVGAAGGGIFKTTDGGLHWKAVFKHEATSSIGAVADGPQGRRSNRPHRRRSA